MNSCQRTKCTNRSSLLNQPPTHSPDLDDPHMMYAAQQGYLTQQVSSEVRGMAEPEKLKNQQCTATSRTTGSRCQRICAPGASTCYYHGSASPAARIKAITRLHDLVGPAIATIARIMATSDNERLRLQAAEAVLDRTGLPRGVKIEAGEAEQLLMHRLIEYRKQHFVDGSLPAQLESPGKTIEHKDSDDDD